MSARLPRGYYEAVAKELRADDWMPRKEYGCGCCPDQLCGAHAVRRAVDHYHPERI